MGDEDDVVMVNNSYRSALESARSACVGPASDLEDALTRARRAMNAGAWEGPMGTDFSGELDAYRGKLNDAGPEALSSFDRAIAGQPHRVPSDAWQVRWRNLAPR
jgi:hypothetical protein